MGTRGLKVQSSIHLKYNDWSADLDSYFNLFINLDKNMDSMRSLIAKYYDESDIDNIMSKIVNLRQNVDIGSGTLPYSYVPSKLISRYGSLDSSVMFELDDFYEKWMDDESKNLNIDIHQGYQYWKQHHIAGYILERNGAYWNEERAKKVEDWCNVGMHESLKYLIASPLSEPYIRDKLYDEFLVYLKDNYIDKILAGRATIKRNFKKAVSIISNDIELDQKLRNMSLYPNDKGIVKLELGNIETLAYDNILKDNPDMFSEWYREYMDHYVNEEHTVNEYKKLLNPGATAPEFKDFISSMLITDDIRYTKFFVELIHVIEDPEFDISQIMDNEDLKLIKLVDKLRTNEDLSGSRKMDVFRKFIENSDLNFRSWKIKRALSKSANYSLASLNAGDMNELYELYLMNHIDIEDETTWTDRFIWLYNYKFYKKLGKTISTYINGKVGRRSVWLVDKKSYESGDTLTRRERLYDSSRDRDGIPDDRTLMVQTGFSINTADTGRWQCLMPDCLVITKEYGSVSIKYLVDNKIDKFTVYSKDSNMNTVEATGINPTATKKVSRVCVVELENGTKIRCTPDHRFLLKTGEYKEAQYLTDEDDIADLEMT